VVSGSLPFPLVQVGHVPFTPPHLGIISGVLTVSIFCKSIFMLSRNLYRCALAMFRWVSGCSKCIFRVYFRGFVNVCNCTPIDRPRCIECRNLKWSLRSEFSYLRVMSKKVRGCWKLGIGILYCDLCVSREWTCVVFPAF
jgi:hypothetical protein